MSKPRATRKQTGLTKSRLAKPEKIEKLVMTREEELRREKLRQSVNETWQKRLDKMKEDHKNNKKQQHQLHVLSLQRCHEKYKAMSLLQLLKFWWNRESKSSEES